MKNHQIIEISCEYNATTEKAIQLVNLDEDSVWLPKSQIEIDELDEKNMIAKIQVPEWLAMEKGLI